MVRVKMLTISADPSGIHHVGEVVSVSHEEAQQLIAGRFAELVDRPVVRETATLTPPENATQPGSTPSSRRKSRG